MPISHICIIPAVKISHLPNFPLLSVLQRIPLWNLILSMPFKPFLDVVFSNVFSGQIYFSGGYYIFLLHRLVSVGSSFTTFDLEGPVLQSVWGCYPVLSCYSWGNIQWVHIFCLKYCEFCYHHTQGWVYRIENLLNADTSDFFVYQRVYRIEPPISSISICPRYAFILSFSAENSPKNPKILWKFRKFSGNSPKIQKIRRNFWKFAENSENSPKIH